jgi:Holliday junction resolvase RusA-like endonuclease
MNAFDWGSATIEDATRERERRVREGVGTLNRKPPTETAAPPVAPEADDGVRCVTLPWSLLVSDNHKHVPARRGAKDVMLLTEAYAKAKNDGRTLVAKQLGNRPPLTGRVGLYAVLIEPNSHVHRDVHNYGKLTMDVLKGLAYRDDWQIDDDHWVRGAVNIDAPRLAIRVYALGGDR